MRQANSLTQAASTPLTVRRLSSSLNRNMRHRPTPFADNRLERGGRGDYAASHARCRHLRPREHEGADGEPEPADPVPGLRGLLPARRARRPGAVRQRRALGSNTRRHEGRARDRTPGVPRAHRLRQRGALGGPELAARPGARRTFARRSRTTRRAASTSSRCSNA